MNGYALSEIVILIICGWVAFVAGVLTIKLCLWVF